MNKKTKLKKLGMVIFSIILAFGIYTYYNNKKINNNNIKEEQKEISNYNKYVITNKETNLYDEKENIVGKIGEKVELIIDNKLDLDNKFIKIMNLDNDYYINNKDIDDLEKLTKKDDRYKKYIIFNENIITNEKTSFYDENDNLIYEFNKSFNLPIIIKDNDKYGVEFNDMLLYIKKENVKEIKENNNTEEKNTSGIAVLNYHAFYDENIKEEVDNCTTEICHSKKQFKSQLEYIKENNILTLKMNEVEKYIDGKIQLPKSVLLTIDDGLKTKHAVDMLTEYQMNATIFLVTSWFNVDEYYKTEYIELHSHTNNLHNPGKCPGGQGGGLKCLSEEEILNDLNQSRKALHGSTALCYPFYEYNEYTIDMAKKAGFTMGFIGESNNSDNLVHIGTDKFRLRRFVIVTYTTLDDLDKYFKQII